MSDAAAPLGHGQRIAQLIKRYVGILRNKLLYECLIGRILTTLSGAPCFKGMDPPRCRIAALSVIQWRLKTLAAPRQYDRSNPRQCNDGNARVARSVVVLT